MLDPSFTALVLAPRQMKKSPSIQSEDRASEVESCHVNGAHDTQDILVNEQVRRERTTDSEEGDGGLLLRDLCLRKGWQRETRS